MEWNFQCKASPTNSLAIALFVKTCGAGYGVLGVVHNQVDSEVLLQNILRSYLYLRISIVLKNIISTAQLAFTLLPPQLGTFSVFKHLGYPKRQVLGGWYLENIGGHTIVDVGANSVIAKRNHDCLTPYGHVQTNIFFIDLWDLFMHHHIICILLRYIMIY